MNNISERLKHDWFILANLVSKDFKLKYRRSILGVLWSVLNPFLMMVVLALVFSFIFRGDDASQPFPVYLILGTTLFNLMAVSTTAGANSIIEAAPLIKKIRINKLIFPLEKVLFELVNFALSLIAVAVVLIYFQVAPTLNLLFLPLLLLYVVIFSVGLSLLLSALAVFFRDIIYLWSVVITAWTYATPLFWPINALPEWLAAVMKFNPMYQFVTYFRSITMCGVPPKISDLLTATASGTPYVAIWQTPSLKANLICVGMALITLVVGFLVFKATQRRFILYV
ncbi:MAG: ABC transporter permease [Actinomycetia bacterium]|nr:ABC transporter permease [Actinomycetes bacterium]